MKNRTILVIDNCPPDLHRILAKVCSGNKSLLSLITIEYDVREDLPEETKVFRLEPASEELIFKLLTMRFSYISEIDRKTIANFSGGNARIAIALANTLQKGEILSGLQDEELFERLFRQRNASDPQLIKSAQVLSLVYSFEGTDITSSKSELLLLGSLISKHPRDLYSDVSELKSRDLIQSRNVWRALLPQAIANRLAKKGLNMVPPLLIADQFMNCGSERLLKSFARRLSYLHDCEAAIEIANSWLAKDGIVGELSNLEYWEIHIFKNIAPVSPDKTLEAIERAIQKSPDFTTSYNSHYNTFTNLLHSLAFDPDLFGRSVKALIHFALNESGNKRYTSAGANLKSLFSLYYSGTHAKKENRYHIIEELLNNKEINRQNLGLQLIEASLRVDRNNAIHRFDFGARHRDYGYLPKDKVELIDWYGFYIKKLTAMFEDETVYAQKAKLLLAQNFRSLWLRLGLYEILEKMTKAILLTSSWYEGWIQVRKTIYFGKDKLSVEALKRLHVLHELLQPKSLKDLIEAYVFADGSQCYEYIDNIEDVDKRLNTSIMRSEEIVYDLGAQLSQDDSLLKMLLPRLVSRPGCRLLSLGQGLAKDAKDKSGLWNKIKEQVILAKEDDRNIRLLLGFLKELYLHHPSLTNEILDTLLLDPILSKMFPYFQMYTGIDAKAIQRLHFVLDNDITPVTMFYSLGEFIKLLTDSDLASLVIKIISKENGDNVALQLFVMRLYSTSEPYQLKDVLISAGCELLKKFMFLVDPVEKNLLFYNLGKLTEICLSHSCCTDNIVAIYRNISNALESQRTYVHECLELLKVLAKCHPKIFLDFFMELYDPYGRQQLLLANLDGDENPINDIPIQDIILWCEMNRELRYPLVLNLFDPFTLEINSNELGPVDRIKNDH